MADTGTYADVVNNVTISKNLQLQFGTALKAVGTRSDGYVDPSFIPPIGVMNIAAGSGQYPRYPRTLEDRATDMISVMEYIPAALRAGIAARTNTADLSGYINQAIMDAPGNL